VLTARFKEGYQLALTMGSTPTTAQQQHAHFDGLLLLVLPPPP
jgi:hypothetical protein